MATYSEVRNRFGKERAEELAQEQGFSSSQIAKESEEYEMIEAISNPSGGLSSVVKNINNKQKKAKKVNLLNDFLTLAHDLMFLKKGDEPKNELVKAIQDSNLEESVEHGLKESVMYKGAKLLTGGEYKPSEFQPTTTGEKALSGITSVLTDTPIFAGGAALGGIVTRNPIAAMSTSFGIHSYLNSYATQELQNDYKKREDYVNMLRQAIALDLDSAINLALSFNETDEKHSHLQDIKEGVKGLVTGAAMGYVGGKSHQLTSKLLDTTKVKQSMSGLPLKKKAAITGAAHSTIGTTAEVGVLGTLPPLLDARVPTSDDFVDSAMVIAGLKLTKIHKTMDVWEKKYKLEQYRKILKEASADYKAINNSSPFTTADERLALFNEGFKLIDKAQKQDRGLTQGNIEEALQLEYIRSGKKPTEVVAQIEGDNKNFQDFMLMANDIMQNGGLDNVMRDPLLRDKYFPKQEFKPVEVKEESIDNAKKVENPEIFVGNRNGKLDGSKKRAEELLNEGKLSREDIRKETGWSIVDVKTQTGENKRFYIFEISDANSKIVVDVNNIKNNSVYTLDQVFEHNNLYDLYPWLRKVRVEFSKGEYGYEGSFNPRSLTFWFNTMYVKDPVEFRKTIIHEVQHIIQGYEEWGRGGSPMHSNPVLPDNIKDAYQERKDLVPFLKEGLAKEGLDVTYITENPHSLDVWRWEMENLAQKDPVYAEKYNRFMELLQTTDVYEAKLSFGRYLRLWGENQSRNASRRADFTEEMIRNIPPEWTQDFPTDMTIVKMGEAIYPKGDYIPNAKNKSALYAYGDKMNVYVGWKKPGTYERADSLANIVNDFIKDFTVVTQNRKSVFKEKMSQGSGTRGVFYINPEFIRTRENNNISIISHEMGHAVEKALLGKGNTFFGKEHRKELKAIATPGEVKSEGFAEMVSWYLINPEYVEKTTPVSYDYFVNKMKKDYPNVLKLLNKYQSKMRAFQNQPSYDAVMGAMTDKAVYGADTVLTFGEVEYMSLVDNLYSLKVYEDVVLSKMTPERKAEYTESGKLPYLEARLLRGVAGTVATYIDGKPVDYQGNVIIGKNGKPLKNLKQILKGMNKAELYEFNDYLFSKRIVEIKEKRLDDIQTPVDPNHARSEVERLAPKYEAKAQEVYEMMDALLKYSADSDLISQDTYKKLREMYPNYIPLVPVKNYTAPGSKSLSVDSPIKHLIGNDNQVMLPILGIEDYINRIMINAQRNKILSLIADLSNEPGAGAFVRKIKESGRMANLPKGSTVFKETKPEDPLGIIATDPFSGDILGIYRDKGSKVYVLSGEQPNEFKVRRGDKYELYVADPQIISAIKGIHDIVPERGKIAEVVQTVIKAPSKVTRAGATAKPTWMLSNLVIDQGTSALNSKHNYIAGVDAIIGLGHIAFNTNEYQQWKSSGGSQSSFFSLNVDGKYYKMLDKYHQEGWGRKLWNTVKTPFEVWNKLGELSDNTTRVGEFVNARRDYLKKGLPLEVANRKAAFDSRDVSIDFSRGGNISKFWNQYDAFFNAEIQGTDKFIRTIKDNPVKGSLILGGLVMGFLYNEYLHEFDKDFQGIRDHIHATNLVFKDKDGKLVKIPLPRELVPLKDLTRRVYRNEFRGMMEGVGGNIVDRATPDILRLLIEPTANYNFYRQQPVVPAYLENEVGEYQYNHNTTQVAKNIASAFREMGLDDSNILTSPMMIENISTNMSGGLLLKIYQTLETYLGSQKVDVYADQKGLFNSTFFVMNTPSNNKYVEEYYKILKDLQKADRAVNKDIMEKGEINKERFDKKIFLDKYQAYVNAMSYYSQNRSKLISGKIAYKDKEGNIDKDSAKEIILSLDKEFIEYATKFVKEYNKQF